MDLGAWAWALPSATLVRYDFALEALAHERLFAAVAVAGSLHVAAGLRTGLYLGRCRFGSFEEVTIFALTIGIATAALGAVNEVVEPQLVPRSAVVAGGVAALVAMGSLRYGWRSYTDWRHRPAGEGLGRILVFGAGEGGAQVIGELLRSPGSNHLPVALLDDDPAKRHRRIRGVRVVGTRADIGRAAAEHRATSLLIAVPSADAALVRDVSGRAAEAGLAVRVLPPVREILDDSVHLSDIRQVTEADLLGRREIDTDVATIARYVTGRRVLVTGAGGSIGAELCRQLLAFAPAELVLVDRDESALHALQLSLYGRASLDSDDIVLLDIRDRERVDTVFDTRRPEVVFHAAALKHVLALERHPGEALKTNVWGTLHMLEAAARSGTACFVNISTDKAADPFNVLGYTKRIGERLTAQVARRAEGTFLSVRFGNVLGSRGSVLTVFRAQADAGGPITVTHPDVTRYFMTVEEAVQLVIQAGAVGAPGQALVFDMGAPVRIADVARRIADEAKRPVEVVWIGLGPGEKLHERLWADDEVDSRPSHPLISHVEVPPVDPRAVLALEPHVAPTVLSRQLRELASTPDEALVLRRTRA